MGERRMDPKKQFSKWLARYGAVAWGAYLLMIWMLMYFRPETSMACVYLAIIVTLNKALDTVAYTKNSTTEKIIIGALDKAKLEFGIKSDGKILSGISGSVKKNAEDDPAPEIDETEDDTATAEGVDG